MEKEKNKLAVQILRLGAFLEREGNRIVKEYNINQQQFLVLRYIQKNQPVCQRDICLNLMYEKSNISKIIKKLKKLRMIRKKYKKGDKRYTMLECTESGKTVISACIERFSRYNTEWLKQVSEQDAAVTMQILETLSNKINT